MNTAQEMIDKLRNFANAIERIHAKYPELVDPMDFSSLYPSPEVRQWHRYEDGETLTARQIAAKYPELPWERIRCDEFVNWAVVMEGITVIFENAEDVEPKPTPLPIRSMIPKDELQPKQELVEA